MIFAKSEKGFTLLEALVAVAILSLGIMGVGTMLSMALVNDKTTSSIRDAERIAQEAVEILKAEAVRRTETQLKKGEFVQETPLLRDTPQDLCINKNTGTKISCSDASAIKAWRCVPWYKNAFVAWTISNHDFGLLRLDVSVGRGKGCNLEQMKIYLGMVSGKEPRESKCQCTTVTNFLIPSNN